MGQIKNIFKCINFFIMEENIRGNLAIEKNSIDIFGQLTNGLGDIYNGKGSFLEYTKSKEDEVNKIKDDILCVLYGTGYKEKLNSRRQARKSPKRNIL